MRQDDMASGLPRRQTEASDQIQQTHHHQGWGSDVDGLQQGGKDGTTDKGCLSVVPEAS